MNITSTRWAGVIAVTVMLVMLLGQAMSAGQNATTPSVTVEQAKPFLGTWVTTLDAPPGPIAFTIDVTAEAGVVAAAVTDQMIGKQKVTMITRRDAALVLSYPVDMMGNPATFTLTLTPEGENMRIKVTVGDGAFDMSGLAKRQK
jgi:hypothetical protein